MMQNEGEPCPVCSMHEIQMGGSGWLRDDGTPLPIVGMYALGKIADPAATLQLVLQKDGNARWKKEFAEPRRMTATNGVITGTSSNVQCFVRPSGLRIWTGLSFSQALTNASTRSAVDSRIASLTRWVPAKPCFGPPT